jgi:tetratricopeptide (TPR) repeat protein
MAERTRLEQLEQDKAADDRFERFVGILIASVTILAAITAFYQTHASTEASRANRRAQAYSLSATTQRLSGAIQFSYDYQGALQTWDEVDLQRTAAEQDNDAARAARFRKLRDHLAGLSPLLNPPYFNGTGWPNSSQYEADLYLVSATKAGEQFAAQAALGNAWDGIASALVIQLTLLAVALALYGLSTTMGSWIKWMMAVVGSGLVLLCFGWLLLTLIWPLPDLPEPAIDAYASGVGLAYQAKDDQAIDQFNKALASKPDYANALYQRGEAFFFKGQYEKAAADYLAAQENGRDDVNVGWELGWTDYLLGQFDKAEQVDQHVLSLAPETEGVRMNLALARLVQGNFDEADRDYQAALDEAARQVRAARAAGKEPPASLYGYADSGAEDLINLLDQIHGKPKTWTQSPPADKITADPGQIEIKAQAWIKRIKETVVALEFNGAPPTGQTSANVSDFRFGVEVKNSQGQFDHYDTGDTFKYGTNAMVILFNYNGFQDGQQEIWKVYRDGVEDPSLRVIGKWKLGVKGDAAKSISYAASNVFILSPGEYRVELYVDTELLKTGTFRVLDQGQ